MGLGQCSSPSTDYSHRYLHHLIHQLDIRPDKLLQRVLTLTHSLRKRIRRQVRALRTGVSVILRVQRIRRCIPQLLIHLRHRRKMIDIVRSLAHIRRRKHRILDKPRRPIPIHAALPKVVRRLAADNHTGASSDIRPRRIRHVLVESVHQRAVLARSAHLVASAGAVAAAVVRGGVGRAAVVVAEFDHDDVASDEEGCDLGEAAFVRVAAGGAAADGFVDYGRAGGEVGFEVGAPAWWWVLVDVSGMGGRRLLTIGDAVVCAAFGHCAVAG
jgi:hypothetical protein